jgi:hypothetical protein
MRGSVQRHVRALGVPRALGALAALAALAALGIPAAQAQPDWDWTPTSASGTLLGQVTWNGVPATAAHWVGAFDPGGHCAGAAQVIENGGLGYVSLAIYGDDATTPALDEGITGGEAFTLRVWTAGAEATLEDAEGNTVFLTNWANTNGAPMPAYADPGVVFAFTGGSGVAWVCPGTVCSAAGPLALTAFPAGGTFSGPGVSGGLFFPNVAGLGTHDLQYTVGGLSAPCAVTVVDNPDATIVPVEALCANDPDVPLEAVTPGGIWSGPGVFAGFLDPSAVTPGTHWVTYLLDWGACAAESSVPVTVFPAPPTPELVPSPSGGLAIAGTAPGATGPWTWFENGLELPSLAGQSHHPSPSAGQTYSTNSSNSYGCIAWSAPFLWSPLSLPALPSPLAPPASEGTWHLVSGCLHPAPSPPTAVSWHDPSGRLFHTGPCIPPATHGLVYAVIVPPPTLGAPPSTIVPITLKFVLP